MQDKTGRRHALGRRLEVWGWGVVWALLAVLALCVGCGDDASEASSDDAATPNNTARAELPEAFVVEVLMPVGEAGPLAELEAARWAVEVVNQGGGILGQVPLELRLTSTEGQDIVALA